MRRFLLAATGLGLLGLMACDGARGGSSSPSYGISGTVSGATGVTVDLTGAATASIATDPSGRYSFSSLANGSYVVTPSKSGYAFLPASIAVTIAGADVTGQNFTAMSNCPTLLEQYATEFQNALICDPGAISPCDVQRPVVVSQTNGQTQTLEGLASNCTHAVNGSRTATLDQILSEYTAEGCKSKPVPICQPPMDVCQLNTQGTYTCLP